ncbi:MAG: CDP-alcohol phosphatidyltransferase family protein [Steroidobacteraceae bacterium]
MDRPALNWPNALSAARLIGSPILLIASPRIALAWTALGIVVLGLTDWLDGWAARRWHQVTPMGSMLDGLADLIFYPCAAALLMMWFPHYLTPNIPHIAATISLLVLVMAVSVIRCGRLILLHTHLSRFAAVLFFFTMLASFVVDTTLAIRAVAILYAVAFIEGIVIFIRYGAVSPDTRSVWSLRAGR